MQNFRFLLSTLLAITSLPVAATALQSHAQIRDTVAAFARNQTQGLPGKASIRVAEIDKRLSLPACTALEAFLPPGAQLNGNSSVGVRCNGKQGWSVFVQVSVKISVEMLTVNKTIQRGQILRAEDLGSITGESLQAGTLTDPSQAIGKIVKFSVGSGQLLRDSMLRAPYSIKQGQAVHIKVIGAGYRVSTEGRALSNAAEGEMASVRTSSGQTISGIVNGGMIEVNP